ncbi:MAG: hypothetical protein K6E58_00055, partial [Eubacterium sp.]|nr:hypothetical protein [Eubacterium sp.]
EPGMYVTFPQGISDCSLSGYAVQGAGIVIYISNFTQKVTEFTVTYGNTTETCYVYYADGTGEEPTTHEQETGEEETTANPWKVVNDSNSKYYYNKDTMVNITSVGTMQQPPWADEEGIYLSLPTPITEVSVNGKTNGVATIDGAGVIVFKSALTRYFNKVQLTRSDQLSYIEIRYVDGDLKYDVEDYKSGATYTYPEKDDEIFAGWYADSNYTTVSTSTSGTAYAKFIDARVLTVKHQWKVSDHSAIRFVSTIDHLDYQDVGFIINGTYGDSVITNKKKSVNSVFTKITAAGESILPSVFCDTSQYFFTYTIRGMNGNSPSTWNIKPYYVTPDGTTVTGKTGKFEYTPA